MTIVCSGCAEEAEVVVESLDDAEREVCGCGCCFAVLSVATFEPVYAEGGELVELFGGSDLSLAA
ncbi:MAG TPA: hypothetical protein VFY48_04985 [Solirubrobacterales bacterium]|nr:hypothetical protein [Solirubrobacterales bacterium]